MRAAEQARELLIEQGMAPERMVVVDSRTGSAGHGLMAVAAVNAHESGVDLAGAVSAAQAMRENLKILMMVDTLEFLRRGGRIGAAQAWIGATLKVKPILTIEGEVQPVERVRTASRAFERLVAHLEQRRENGCDGFVIQHVQTPEQAERLAERGREIYGRDPELISEIGPVIGTHIGPGVLGVTGLKTSLSVRSEPARRRISVGAGLNEAARWASRSILRTSREAPMVRLSPVLTDAQRRADAARSRVAFAVSLYLVYLLRRPIGWVLIATFLAVALSGPVNLLNDYMRRGFAITIVYLCLLLIPIGIGAVIVPPLVEQGNNLIQNLPSYAEDVQEFADKNEQLRELEADYNITEKLQEQAERLPARIGDAANVLGNIGLGVVNSLFALFTILVLAAFLLGSGRTWINRALELRPPGEAAAAAQGLRPHGPRGRRLRRRHARAGHASPRSRPTSSSASSASRSPRRWRSSSSSPTSCRWSARRSARWSSGS